jgi:hypothetical protein
MKTTEKQPRRYAKPEVLGTYDAKATIQSAEDAKPGHLNDGTEATGPAYEADE